MKVYSLTGKSGTGKSYQAMALCKEKDIGGIIDDGLFIYKNKVEAGISAKREKTRVGAIKTALFTKDEHAASVSSKIREMDPESILIIGTSDKMADQVVERLGLPGIEERIHIEDITTEEERSVANKQRIVQGKHVIPVPTLQLKRDFAGYFMDPLRLIRGRRGGERPAERTVVRPTFSYMGDFFISEKVITDIAQCVAEEHPKVAKIIRVYENTEPDSLSIDVSLALVKCTDLWDAAMDYQQNLAKKIEDMTAFNVVKVDVEIKQVV